MPIDQPSFLAHATHPGLGEEPIDGRVTIDQWHFHFRSGDIHVQIPLGQLDIAPGEAEAGGIFFSDPNQRDWTIYTFDERILRDVHLTTNAYTRLRLKSFRTRGDFKKSVKITLWVLGGFAGIALAVTIFCSVAVRVLVSKIPPKLEEEIGADFLAELKQEETFVTNSALQARIDAAAAPLLAVLPTNQISFKFFIVEDSDPNAFSMPGGYIVFTTGLLERMDTQEQLAGVLAHEASHITEKHVFRQVISSFGPVLLMSLLFQSSDHRGNIVSDASSLLIVQSFSQEYEFEADDRGWKYLLAAHVNPHGMIEMLSKLKAYEDGQKDLDSLPGAFSSHPATGKRIHKLDGKWKRLKDKSHFLDYSAAEKARDNTAQK